MRTGYQQRHRIDSLSENLKETQGTLEEEQGKHGQQDTLEIGTFCRPYLASCPT